MKLSLLAKLWFCLAMAAAMLPSHAAESDVYFEAHPVQQLFQEQNESWDDFVSRSARVMRDYTRETNFEAGGWLCVNPDSGRGAISVISNHSQISVSAGIKGCPLGGYRLTPEFMHSHPVKEHIVLTEHDLHGYPMGKVARLMGGMRAGSRVHVGKSGGRFSQPDMAIGPGYLVHGNDLHYQKNGRQHFARSIESTGVIRDSSALQTLVASY